MKPGKDRGTGRHPVAAIYRALVKAYGPLPRWRPEPPVDVLIGTILSQNTSGVNSERAYRALRRRFPKWIDVIDAPLRDMAKAIHGGGLSRIKAARIRQTLRVIRQREGRLSLARLKVLPHEEALNYLSGLPGVGIKTACCVLLFGFHQPVMPVDTHVYRIAGRLGWIRRKTPVEQVHPILERMIPGRWILPMHLYFIELGRRICRSRHPRCYGCPIARDCAVGRMLLS